MDSRRKIKIGILVLILIVSLGLWGCGNSDDQEKEITSSNTEEVSQDSKPVTETVSGEGINKSDSIEKNNENGAVSIDAASVQNKTEVQSSSVKVEKTQKNENQQTDKYSIKISGSGLSGEVVLSEADIRNLATESYSYSFRNKEKNNARQYGTFKGVSVSALLKAAGWNGTSDKLRITCTDGYSNRYKLSEINALYTYQEGSETSDTKVPALIAVLDEGSYIGNDLYYHYDDGPPFRLIYGQEDYDSDFTKDFNMQGWGYYISEISID